MYSWVDQSTALALDRLTSRHGFRGGSDPELRQLARLFSPAYVRSLHRLLSHASRSSRGRRVLDVKLGWIDKSPYAEINGRPRTELGDAAIFAIESYMRPDGSTIGSTRARCVIVQAKVTSDATQLTAPTVPTVHLTASELSNPKSSTARELRLLRDWPTFDLYDASRSLTPNLTGVDIRNGAVGTLPMGWFIAAPRLVGRTARPKGAIWPSWWMCAQPVNTQPFDVSFGSFFRALLTGGKTASVSGHAHVGADFLLNRHPAQSAGPAHWDALCHEMLRLSASSKAPQHIFTTSVAKLASVPPIYSSYLTGSAPTLLNAHGRCWFGSPKENVPAIRRWDPSWYAPPYELGSRDDAMRVLIIRSTEVER